MNTFLKCIPINFSQTKIFLIILYLTYVSLKCRPNGFGVFSKYEYRVAGTYPLRVRKCPKDMEVKLCRWNLWFSIYNNFYFSFSLLFRFFFLLLLDKFSLSLSLSLKELWTPSRFWLWLWYFKRRRKTSWIIIIIICIGIIRDYGETRNVVKYWFRFEQQSPEGICHRGVLLLLFFFSSIIITTVVVIILIIYE